MKKIRVLDYSQCIKGSTSGKLSRDGLEKYEVFNSSAGIKVEFSTTTSSISVSYVCCRHEHCKAEYGAFLMKGITYKIKDSSGKVIKRNGVLNKNLTTEEVHFIHNWNKLVNIECEFYLPSMATVSEMYIYIDDDANIQSIKKEKDKVVFLGGPNTLGCGCTFANTTLSRIISNSLNLENYNFASNTHNLYNFDIIECVKTLNPAVVISELYSVLTDVEYMRQNINEYVDRLVSASKATLFIFWELPYFSSAGNLAEKHKIYLQTKDFILKKYKNCIFINSHKLFENLSNDEYSISSYYINDYANYVIANKIVKTIRTLRGE